MISKEEAQERLRSFYDPDSATKQLARLGKLQTDISSMGQILIQAGPVWEKLYQEYGWNWHARSQPLDQLAKLNPKNRQALFAALFPGIASFAEATWDFFDHLPYQAGHYRRPFRNPAQKLLEARTAWLQRLAHLTKGYEHQDVVWFASWAAHLGYLAPDVLGTLFAATIDAGGKTGDETFEILISSANGTHETGMMGHHVVRGLLCSARAQGWEHVERMLLAAQREEGLRQVILESIDEAHSQAFRSMLRVVVDNNLSRFSASMRAFSVWFGLPFEGVNPKVTNRTLGQLLHYLDSRSECEQAVKTGEAQDIYYALWALAFDDVLTALPLAVDLSHSADVEKRFVAVHLLAQMNLQECLPELLRALDDEDLRIPARALTNLNVWDYGNDLLSGSDLFERLERLLPRIQHKQNNLKPLVWEWLPILLDREEVTGRLIDCLGKRSATCLIPYLSTMNPRDRGRVAHLLTESRQKDGEILQTLLSLVGDPSPGVREEALKALNGIALSETDAVKLEGLLSRQSQDLRRGIIQLLLNLPDKQLVESLHRLMRHKGEKQRLAALELLRECKQKDRILEQARSFALEHQQRQALTVAETVLLGEILAESVETYTLDDALGLADLQNLTKPVPVKPGALTRLLSKIKLGSPAAVACLKSIDTLVQEHRNDVVEIEQGDVKATELLGNIRWRWMLYGPNTLLQTDLSGFPLKDISETWWLARPQDLRDADGFELMRALIAISIFSPSRVDFSRPVNNGITKELQGHFDIPSDFKLNYVEIIRAMVEWLIWAHPAAGETDFILDALEESVGRIPYSELTEVKQAYGNEKNRSLNYHKLACLDIARWQRELRFDSWKDEHHARLWNVVRWLDEPEPGVPGEYAMLDDALFAYQAGAATRDDLFHMFLGPRKLVRFGGYGFYLLNQYSVKRLRSQQLADVERFPVLREVVDACRERILDVECRRGELPTAATAASRSIRSVPGIKNLFRMLVALGDAGFERGYGYGQSRSGVFSHLIRNSYPVEGEAVEDFVRQARDHQIPEERLIELAVYAPQWVGHVQRVTGWDHLNDAVWWLYAHTKDRQWTVESEIREEWAARITEYTPLSANDLMDGAVDVAWFHKVYSEIGEERWDRLYKAALYTSGGIGHTRARLFSDAMLGRMNTEQAAERIVKKRHQDSARALGLIPLPDKKSQKNEILRRYEVMQEFLRTGKKFGSQRQASEKLAVSIGMQNLARTAGYADPQRLEWAMEIEAVADLSSGPVKVNLDDLQVTLEINDLGEPNLEFHKNGKPVKTIPAAIKKNEKVAALLERKHKLDRQVSRMRMSLEQTMCRGDEFTVAELKTLFQHPMLKTMIEQLLFISAETMGYPIRNGAALYSHDGKETRLADADRLRIAHPIDLLENGEWDRWQRECFLAERIQPFKQVFRELYALTSTEKDEGNLSRRYAGHQVNPRQAVALFGARGWVVDPSEGVQRTFHAEGISARVGFLQGMYTPAEVEGLTIEAVVFTKRGAWEPVPLAQIPPRIFSEVMRDLDLVVSVAHAGGIDPESSASSIQARAALMRETCTLLNLSNVQLSEKHVLINGKISNYNVNLGSGVVHKQPGGALCIIPVHAQQRGRIFLPFVDNDPKTAEIVSKVVLLARDDQIKDPTILEQIL